MRRKPLLLLCATLLIAAGGCSSEPGDEPSSGSPATGGEAVGGAGGWSIPAGGGGASSTEGAVYVNTQSKLLRLEPSAKTLTEVGDFDCVLLTPDPSDSQDGMADLALSAQGEMYGVGRISAAKEFSIVKIDKTTAHCTQVATADATASVIGLTFVPAEASSSGAEELVGLMLDGALVRYDLPSGAPTTFGQLSGAAKAGDLVSLAGGDTFATGNAAGGTELLIIDPATGAVTSDVGNTGVPLLAGLGFWAGTLYGFSADGKLFAIDPATAEATEVPVAGAPTGSLVFWGAAVTTVAPLDPPN